MATDRSAAAGEEALYRELLDLLRTLVRCPSQGGIDATAGVIDALAAWLAAQEVPYRILASGSGERVGVLIALAGREPGATLCLNACLDTAPAGREEAWSHPPFGAEEAEGRLYGRGAADSKAAVAMFSLLAREISRAGGPERGTLCLLFDADEHTGRFGGVRTMVEGLDIRPGAVLIGYPGNRALMIGARGFFRAVLQVFGVESHSGAKDPELGRNAIVKMAALVRHLDGLAMPTEPDGDFAFGPRATITGIQGGDGFSQVPGECSARLDVRLTPGFQADRARELVSGALAAVDREYPGATRSTMVELESWPAYKVPPESPLVETFLRTARAELGRPVELGIAGPSNVGNYLAQRGIPAFCGFGVTYANLHGVDEWIELASLMPIYRIYRDLVPRMLAALDAGAAGAGFGSR